jgi:L-iditol 2-dehydrogenase
MRVARLHAWGDVRVEDAPVPRPAEGEIVVRIDACGVCGSDALVWYVESKAPAVLGHEPAGVIAAVGTGVSGLSEGDRVFVHHHAPCRACAECRRGLWSNCATWRATRLDPGGFAEYARVPAVVVDCDTLPLPDGMDVVTATFIEPVACCLRAVKRQGRVGPEDSVHVVGLGAMGQVMAQLARILGASRVTGSDFIAERRNLATRLGADAAFHPGETDVPDALRSANDGRGADVIIVCPGAAGAIQAGIATAAPGARVVCFTPLHPSEALVLDQNALYFREIALLQSYSCGPDETRAALDLLAGGKLRVDALVSHRTGLEGVAGALERAHGKGDGLKTIILPGLT